MADGKRGRNAVGTHAGMRQTSTGAGKRYADAALALVVVLIIGMMILPLPTGVLDVLLASNISIAVLMMLVALHIRDGLAFTSFPTVLLVTTLYRLALNVSSTRLILLQADAGSVIDAFGNFVVRGNYVVGAVVFLILTLIQFLVIAKGSERVAEVGARFTLDAMPGKQMSIDAELRSGVINQDLARHRRQNLQRESQFYGAMDGAMKFVKGDAIAGIVITVINIVGGLTIGVVMNDWSAQQSLVTYGLLTIGDGLVSQIPALLISTAAGLVVTRVASEAEDTSLGSEIAGQIFGDPRPMKIAALFLLALAIVPGLPAVPFLILAGLLFVTTRNLEQRSLLAQKEERLGMAEPPRPRSEEGAAKRIPLLVPIVVRLGEDLADRLLGGREDALNHRALPELEETLFRDLGITLPRVHTMVDQDLDPNGYAIAIQEIHAGDGVLGGGKLLAMAPIDLVAAVVSEGEPSLDPATERPATWVATTARERLEAQGFEVRDEAIVVASHLGRAVTRRAHDLIGLQETQSMLDQLERAYPALVRNVVPKPASLGLLADVLRRLVEEGVSIRPMREILEAMATHAATERDPTVLTELVRSALARQIARRFAAGGELSVLLLEPPVEEAIRDAIQRTQTGTYLAMPPDLARDIVEAAARAHGGANADVSSVILTQADIRRFVRKLVESTLPDLHVLSYQELAPDVSVQPVGRVAV